MSHVGISALVALVFFSASKLAVVPRYLEREAMMEKSRALPCVDAVAPRGVRRFVPWKEDDEYIDLPFDCFCAC